jgi:hypothetical protein
MKISADVDCSFDGIEVSAYVTKEKITYHIEGGSLHYTETQAAKLSAAIEKCIKTAKKAQIKLFGGK